MSRQFSVSLRLTSWQQVVVMELGKRRNATDTTDFCPRQVVTDLLWICYTGKSVWGKLATGKSPTCLRTCNLAPLSAVDIFVRPSSSGYETNYDRRPSFAVAGPRAWNSLPQFVIDCSSPGTFRQYLKTYLFSLSFQSTEQHTTDSVKRPPCSSFPPLTTL